MISSGAARRAGSECHRRCFGMWQEHQQSIGQKLTCPHCRSDWLHEPSSAGPSIYGRGNLSRHTNAASGAPGAASGLAVSSSGSGGGNGSNGSSGAGGRVRQAKTVHRDARCKSCRALPIHGPRYRCLVCPERTELCGDCFASCMHPQHPFARKERPSSRWTAAPCRAPGADGEGGTGRDGGGVGGVVVVVVVAERRRRAAAAVWAVCATWATATPTTWRRLRRLWRRFSTER